MISSSFVEASGALSYIDAGLRPDVLHVLLLLLLLHVARVALLAHILVDDGPLPAVILLVTWLATRLALLSATGEAFQGLVFDSKCLSFLPPLSTTLVL